MCELRFDADDLLRCRFAISPVSETQDAVRVLHQPHRQQFHLPWLRRLQIDPRDLEPLMALHSPGWGPDFWVPPPDRPGPEIEEQLREVRATPVELVERDLRRTLDGQRDPRYRALIQEMLANPAAARDRIADLLMLAFNALIGDDWTRLRDLLEADITYRTRLFATAGLGATLQDLDKRLVLTGNILTYQTPQSEPRDLAGRGLLLMPSVFVWPSIGVMLDPPWQPMIVYPARGIGRLWQAPSAEPGQALARLIGRTRARILAALTDPAATTTLARELGLSAGGVSAHLTALRDAGLVTTRRDRHRVLYEHTPLGLALLTTE